jgi:hypothetical protein
MHLFLHMAQAIAGQFAALIADCHCIAKTRPVALAIHFAGTLKSVFGLLNEGLKLLILCRAYFYWF